MIGEDNEENMDLDSDEESDKPDETNDFGQVIIKGNVANQGIVKGFAKLLFDFEDIKKVYFPENKFEISSPSFGHFK